MIDEQVRQEWGTPAQQQEPAPRKGWSGRKAVVAVALAAVLAAGGGVAVYAATSGDSGTSANTPMGAGPGGGGGGPGGMGALASALHGELVASDGTTELLQTGEVTAVSATSISVTSTDGYAQTYTIGSSTTVDNGLGAIGDLTTGEQVTVIATKSDSTAVSITDQSGTPQAGQPSAN